MKDGFLNLLKPPGMSSFDAVHAVRRCLGIRKAGHAGTLDPGAAGVLPIAVGRAARLIEYLAEESKEYRGELLLGAATDSCDDTGAVLERREDFSMPGEEEIRRVVAQFTGKIRQTPPKYSAVKIGGKRACDLMREHRDVEIPEREIEIFCLEPVVVKQGMLLLDVECSKGTYIRSLCRDIGAALGIPAAMGFLLRTRVGAFRLEDSVTLEELQEQGEAALQEPHECLTSLLAYELPEHRRKAFCNGLSTHVEEGKLPERFRVYSSGDFLGIGGFRPEDREVIPVKVY